MKNPDIDLGLAIARALHPGERMTIDEIAAYCSCSRSRIAAIEQAALQKVRRLLRLQGISGDLAEALREL